MTISPGVWPLSEVCLPLCFSFPGGSSDQFAGEMPRGSFWLQSIKPAPFLLERAKPAKVSLGLRCPPLCSPGTPPAALLLGVGRGPVCGGARQENLAASAPGGPSHIRPARTAPGYPVTERGAVHMDSSPRALLETCPAREQLPSRAGLALPRSAGVLRLAGAEEGV